MNKKEDSIIWEMVILIVFYGILVQIAGVFFVKQKILYTSGLWIGIMLAVFMLIYMYRVLRAGLGGASQEAVKFVRKHSVIRYITVVAVYGLVIIIPLGNPLSCFAGIMGLKLAAYLQPVMHSFLEKRKD